MKSFTAVLFALLVVGVHAQSNNEGQMIYNIKFDLHASMEDSPNSEMMKQMVPQYQESKMVLFYSEDATLYQNVEDEDVSEEEITHTSGNTQMKIEIDMTREEEKTYTDLKNKNVVETKELMGKVFLIKSDMKASAWKITDESEEILGMKCMKAVASDTSNHTEVWYTPEIPVSSGPMGLGGLPGLILKVSAQDGIMTLTASENEFRKLKKSEMNIPNKGKEVTKGEFEKIQAEKMKQMQEMYGGSGNMIIIGE